MVGVWEKKVLGYLGDNVVYFWVFGFEEREKIEGEEVISKAVRI